MPQISWLHLTDLHRGMSAQSYLWPNIEKTFFEDLEALHDLCGPWDIILFSGDLVQKGAPEEFRKLDDTLRRLYEKLNDLGSDPVLLAVPGNHDLKRPPISDPTLSQLDKFNSDPSLRQEFWGSRKSPSRALVRKSFGSFGQWLKNHPFKRPHSVTNGMLPGDFAAIVEKDDLRVGVVGLNTAFLQLQEGNFEGRLVVNARQLVAVCGEHFTDWFDRCTACFLMTHHPPSWLTPNSREALKQDIAIPGRFLAHLCGHLHDSAHERTSVGGDGNVSRTWQGSSLFGLEFYGDDQRSERKHGYSAGLLDIQGSTATLRVWPRLAAKHEGGRWRFLASPALTLEGDGGTTAETAGNVFRSPKRTSAKPKYRVLLLATEPDFGRAKKTIRDHLERSLGVLVAETQTEQNASEYDLAVLMQGWWWDRGELVQIWQRCDPLKRKALLVREDSDWPPRKLAEFNSDTDVRNFRSSIADPILFSSPDELPELVSKVVTESIQSGSGNPDLGLREFERRYLEFRLSAWRSGRTAQGKPHLFNAEQAQELYAPSLYVPMDGVAIGWEWGRDGSPRRMKRRRRKKKSLESSRAPRRVALARWLGVTELPRLVVVGAPGGGKTIFLTRIAASLANSCLGRGLDLEPELNIERLRRDSSLPIPVVLESTRFPSSEHTLKIEALLQVMHEEMDCTGTGDLSPEEIENGLKRGRYLLLVDALDEVADPTARSQVLGLLKAIAGVYPETKLLLTTRSARYTGDLRFGPELETVEIAALSPQQIKVLCTNWSTYRKRDEHYSASLLSAAEGLRERVEGAGEDQAITENPLMLTAVCMVFDRYRSLPDDRGRLCELLIEDLCRSRRSEDPSTGWKLDESAKKDLLQRIALEMQRAGAQAWPVERAIGIAQQLVPTTETNPHLRAKKYLDWAADHTGILRFQETPSGGEQIRFWHRIFREYLAAYRIAQLDTTADRKIQDLWGEGRLREPFWEDVIRLLPRTLGTIEKAQSVRDSLEKLATENKANRGRLLALAAAGIIENRDLFPEVHFAEKASEMAVVYESEGLQWSLRDRLLFLETLGRLDPNAVDPRAAQERWIELNPAQSREPEGPENIRIASMLVTVQEFLDFLNAKDFQDSQVWSDMPPQVVQDREPQLRIRANNQRHHPNWPIVDVGVGAAIAYCRWRTKLRTDKLIVRLPTSTDWHRARTASAQKHIWGNAELLPNEEAQINWVGAGIGHPTPIGAFRPHVTGIYDLIGNVWEWAVETRVGESHRRRKFIVLGGSFDVDPREWHDAGLLWATPAPPLERGGHPSIGFRCLLSAYDLKISSTDFSREA